MQINNEFAPVMKSSSKMETAQASIAMTAHMFQILSAGIYQHPVRACIRELSCNAYDTQVEAGNADKPFKVHLPNQLEPYFEVRDYGMGMTHEQVMKLYLTYGASTKRDTNDQIGGLGIGSKSPFAVAQSFTVTSYKDGTVRRYSIYMEEGVPQVTKLTESATSEPNGVAVRVAIPLDKLGEFEREANRVYTHFAVKPDCNRPLIGLYDDYSLLSEEPGVFKVFSGTNNSRSIDTSIVMGNIEYPIKLEDVMPNYEDVVPAFLRQNISKALIYLPIGTVNIAASRESLQLTDNTKQAIVDIFSQVSAKILTKFQEKIDTAKTLYDAIKLFNDAVGQNRIGQRGRLSVGAQHSLMKNLSWGGKTLDAWYTEQAESRTQQEIDPADGKPRVDFHGRPKMEYKYPGIPYYRVWNVQRKSEKRLDSHQCNSASDFSLFQDMAPEKLEKETLWVIDNRFQKNGAPKTVGRAVILKAIANQFVTDSGSNDGRMFMVRDQAELDLLMKVHHYPADKMRVYKTADFESAYQPTKVVRGQVKLWEVKEGKLQEVKVDLATYDNPQYYIKASGQDFVTENLRNGADLKDTMVTLSKVVPTGHVFMFRKATWGKIPDEWVEIDLKVIHKLVRETPYLWIELNHNATANTIKDSRPNLTKLKVKANMTFNNKNVQDGYVDVLASDKKTPDPLGMNFEDNLDVIRDIFGRPQIVFADLWYRSHIYENSTLENLLALLPKKDKLYRKIIDSRSRARANVTREKKKSIAKNRLLSWIDWSKVSLRELAEYLGHNVTPYIPK